MRLLALLVALVLTTSSHAAFAQDDFGPEVVLERIDIVGNDWTAERLIRRALLVQEGETLRAGDPRFRISRFRILALGYFADVRLELSKGSQRGRVVLTVEVVERGTITLNRIYFGTNETTPVWLGIDGGDANFLGTGLRLGGGVVWAAAPDLPGGRDQFALRLRYGDPSLFGLPVGVSAAFLYNQASEPIGDQAFSYDRIGGEAGFGVDLTRLSRVVGGFRLERIDGMAPGFVLDDESLLTAVSAGYDRDTRADPVLTYSGDRMRVLAEAGGPWTGSDYEYARVMARYERWFSLGGGHVVSGHLAGGILFGDPPGFERFYVGDWNRMLAPRPLGLVVTTSAAPDFLDLSRDPRPYGDLAGSAELQYAYRLFRRSRTIYGGDLFAGVGVVALADRGEDSRTIDLTFDVGLRLDTEVGIFELSLANALGRVPF